MSSMSKSVLVSESWGQTPRVKSIPTECDRLILILDESGSMSDQKDDIIGGVNEMIRQQRKVEPERNHKVFFDIVKFSTTVEPTRSHTLSTIREFTSEDYTPAGSTALYDAIGSTIKKYRNEDNVVLVIATDGGENVSKSFSYTEIVRMISEQREHHNWNIVYLSEDISTFEQGNRLGIVNHAKGSFNVAVGSKELGKAFQTQYCQQNIANLRKGDKASFSGLSAFSKK
jgi:hypothetical protein